MQFFVYWDQASQSPYRLSADWAGSARAHSTSGRNSPKSHRSRRPENLGRSGPLQRVMVRGYAKSQEQLAALRQGLNPS